MRIKTLLALVAMGVSSTHAATITVNTSGFVQDADGVLVKNNTGSIAIGTYGVTDPDFSSGFTAADIMTGFMQLGQSAFSEEPKNRDGLFAFELTAEVTSAFSGLPVYLVIGNSASLATSDEFLVWKATANPLGNTFVADDPFGGPGGIRLDSNTGSLFAGITVSAGDRDDFRLVAIPEPSSTALLGLGGVALLLRRRR